MQKILKKGSFYKIVGCVEIDSNEEPIKSSTELCIRIDGIHVIKEEDLLEHLEEDGNIDFFEVETNEKYLSDEYYIDYEVTLFGSLENRDFEGRVGNDGEYVEITDSKEISLLLKTLSNIKDLNEIIESDINLKDDISKAKNYINSKDKLINK